MKKSKKVTAKGPKAIKNLMVLINMNLTAGTGQATNNRTQRTYINEVGNNVSPPIEVSRVIPGDARIIGMEYANNSLPIQITRNSYNIPAALPYYLFCPDALSTNYATVAADAGTLPVGTTSLTAAVFQNRAIRLTFVVGGATDTIDITTQFPVPYPIILEMINSGDWFVSEGFQQTVGTNFNAQFNGVSLSFGQLAFSGFKGSNAIPLSNAKSPFQFQQNIIAVNRRITINTRRYVSMMMAASAPAAGDEIVINDFDISVYHSSSDFVSPVVSSFRTNYMGGGSQ